MKLIDYIVSNRVATIVLNRPEKRNAFNEDLVIELRDAFEMAENDSAVKVILLRANGEVFSAGADLAYLQKMTNFTAAQNLEDSTALAKLFRYIYTHPKVIVAQVQGHAIAGGCGLATLCDFTFSVPEAQFGYPEVKIGFVPAIVMVFLVRQIGEGKARELLLSGRLFGAREAQNLGLVTGVFPAEIIESEVSNFLEKLCVECSKESLKLTKKMIGEVQNKSLDEALGYAAKMNAEAKSSDDCKKGLASFLTREKMQW